MGVSDSRGTYRLSVLIISKSDSLGICNLGSLSSVNPHIQLPAWTRAEKWSALANRLPLGGSCYSITQWEFMFRV